MTLLEVMIVLAILAAGTLLLRGGLRALTQADLVEDTNELAGMLRRASTLAVEHGEMHRVTLDLDAQAYVVEVCQGPLSISRNEALRADEDQKKRALDRAKERLAGMPQDTSSNASTDPQEATRRAVALSGHHIADRLCGQATDSIVGGATFDMGFDDNGSNGSDSKKKEKKEKKGWVRKLRAGKGIKFKEVWVQHKDESSTKGQVAIYFFPDGSSEKAVIEVSDGSDMFSVLVSGLTGQVEVKTGALRDVNDHMMRNAMGEKDAKRETER
jgi:general secretion pathway protein H